MLHWFRHGDLRLHDNPALVYSVGRSNHVVPVFCFDRDVFGAGARRTPTASSHKCGARRARFVSECVADLRANLRSRYGGGAELLVAHGDPAAAFGRILSGLEGRRVDVVVQDEVLREERDAVARVRAALAAHRPAGTVHAVWGSTLYERPDLPFADDLRDMPDVFTPFRDRVERRAAIRAPLPVPARLAYPADDLAHVRDMVGFLPTLADLGYGPDDVEKAERIDPRGVLDFRGGESSALRRLKEYVWDKDLLRDYFDTRNGMIGADYSTKLSPWLAHGCVSARLVARECKKYEAERVANKSTYWVVFELLWRDYCKYFALKHGDALFRPGGTVGGGADKTSWPHRVERFAAWRDGRTGYPLVDANMRELKATGFMSNRGRQNVASFLALDCDTDWRAGGDWFETHLLDYDVYSNWVNWCAAAGMTGGRVNRFNVVKQSKDYDQHGDYVRLWLPELRSLPDRFIHEPWKMNQFQQIEYNVRLGVDYPGPIVPPPRPNTGGADEGREERRGTDKQQQQRQRKPNSSGRNRHQRHEMKSLRPGQINIR